MDSIYKDAHVPNMQLIFGVISSYRLSDENFILKFS